MQTSPDPSEEIQPTPKIPRPGRGRRSCSGMIIVYSAFLLLLFCVIGFVPYWRPFVESAQTAFQRIRVSATPAATLKPGEPTVAPVKPGEPTATLAPAKISPCVVIWIEHPEDDLGKKSRAKVYERVISQQVKDTGMTAKQFYDLVVEHNPQLIGDDYEFKKGKTYNLPVCQ